MRRYRTRTRVFLALAAALLSLSALVPAEAFSQAFFHTQSVGNRGTNVRAIQFLLRRRGHDIAADGIFGSATESAVETFQRNHNLAADGIVGPLTWAKLVITVSSGDTGEAVKAVQSQLNEKRGAGLAVDGVFGPATRSAVINFQQHAGIAADGIVGPTTWRNLIWHYEKPNFGLASVCNYDGGNGAAGDWGTSATVRQLEAAAIASYGAGNGKVAVGDISLEHGGEIAGHESHEVGLDVDIRPIRDDRAECSLGTTWQSSSYDRAATRALVKSIRSHAPGHVKLIFFNDPVLIDEGLTTPFPNHDNHLHIRYCEKVHPDSRYVC